MNDATKPLVITLRENETLPNTTLQPEQATVLHDQYKSKQLRVERALIGNGYHLTAGGYIGVIVLDGLRIVIEPKVPIANLFHMLTYAHKLADFGRDLAPLIAGESIFDSVARIFVRQVDDIVRRGIHRGYIDHEEDASYLRGGLLMARQVRRAPIIVGFYQRTNEFTADLLENRILKTALALLGRVRFRDAELGPLIRRTLSAFSEVSSATVRPSDCDHVTYSRLNERYRSPVNLARLFLRHLSLEGRSGETPFVSFLLPMHQLFEQFVARLLVEELATRPRYRVEDQGRIWLDEERRLEGRPDLVLKFDGRDYLVLDTKYKVYGDKQTNEDINQMITYCRTLGVDRSVLIYPNDEAVADQYRMRAGVQLELRSLSLTGSLETFRTRCIEFATSFVETI